MPTEDPSYHYSSNPQPIKGKKSKYRENEVPLNMMSDPRVIRGSTTVLAKKLTAAKDSDSNNAVITRESALLDEKVVSRATYRFDVKPYSGIDLSLYLTEQNSHASTPDDNTTQTDIFLKRPPTPEYVPRKTGVDISTQVDDVRDLFKFDLEVQPIVDVIVQKTLEQALFEVRAEEELFQISREADKFYEANIQERLWIENKEKEAKEKAAVHKRDITVLEEHLSNQVKVKTLVAGIQAIKQLVPSMLDEICTGFYNDGTWYRSERVTVHEYSVKPVTTDAVTRHKAYTTAKEMVQELLSNANKLYDSSPLFVEPSLPRQIVMKLFMKYNQPEGEMVLKEGEETGVDIANVMIDGYKEIGQYRIGNKDSIQSINNMIKKDLKERSIALEFNCKDYIYAAAGREVSLDGYVLNFPLPDVIQIHITNS